MIGGFLLIQWKLETTGLHMIGWKNTRTAAYYKNDFHERYLLVNRWLFSGEVEFKTLMPKINYVSRHNKKLFDEIIKKINVHSWNEFIAHGEELANKRTNADNEIIINLILGGKTYAQAVGAAEQILDRKKRINEMLNKTRVIIAKIIKPLETIGAVIFAYLALFCKIIAIIGKAVFIILELIIWYPLKFIVLVIAGIIGSIFLGKFMKDVCPYTYRQEVL